MTVDIPKIMRTLEKDRRGYPIPVIVLRDRAGKPLFTRNDSRVVLKCERKNLCSICGKKLKEAWFVSGSRAFLHPNGVFVDPPLHYECAEYALQVCPFLAAPQYYRSIAGKTPRGIQDIAEKFVGPMQPELFGLGMARKASLRVTDDFLLRYSIEDWAYVEFWRDGKALDQAPTAARVKELLAITT